MKYNEMKDDRRYKKQEMDIGLDIYPTILYESKPVRHSKHFPIHMRPD